MAQRRGAQDAEPEGGGHGEHAGADHPQVHRPPADRGGQRAPGREQDPRPRRKPGRSARRRPRRRAAAPGRAGRRPRCSARPTMTAAAAPMMSRSLAAARRLAAAADRGAAGPGGTRSTASPAVITAKPAPAASSGTASPRCCGERARRGGARDAADACAGDGPAQGRGPSGGTGEPAETRGPHHAVARPRRRAGRRAGAGKLPARACASSRGRHQQACGQRDPPGAEAISQRPGGHGHRQAGQPGRGQHHPLLESGQAEPVGVDRQDRDQRELGGRAGQDETVDQQAERPAPSPVARVMMSSSLEVPRVSWHRSV